jgi:hypothetical protein
MLVCNHLHVKSFEEGTYTPAILSPRNNNQKPLFEPTNTKVPYQFWLELVQRLRERTLMINPSPERTIRTADRHSCSIVSRHTTPSAGIRRERTWAGHDSISPWNNAGLNSNRQVMRLINNYTNLLSAENNEQFTEGSNSRPKSILRPMRSPNKHGLSKEVTFATN